MPCTPDDDQRFVAEHERERGVLRNREACFQLLQRLQREGPDPYVVVIPLELRYLGREANSRPTREKSGRTGRGRKIAGGTTKPRENFESDQLIVYRHY
jgi:hypothetical protein